MRALRSVGMGILALALVAPLRAAAPAAPTPESVLGFRPGDDRKLADWTQMVTFWRALAAASPRVRVDEVGKTTEGRPFLVVTLTSEENMRRLEDIRRANLRLADPRGLSDEDAEKLIAEGRTIVALNHGIHSTEVGASLSAMELGHRLATTTDPALLRILDRVVIVMLPSHNPDGVDIVTDWYRRTLATPWEGTSPPRLYQKYVGHDDNRDWYMFTQQESRLTVRFLYDRWRPQIVHDLHQMGTRGARLFVPPYVDPYEPNVDPVLIGSINALGTHMAAALTAQGKPGVAVHALYDAWTPGRAYPHTHAGVRILSEAASAALATPVEIKPDQLEPGLGYDAREASWNFPMPWTGGTWRLRDIVDEQIAASLALLEHASEHREYWLRTFLDVGRRASARRDPYAFVLPSGQRDALAATRLLEALRLGGVELQRARSAFEADGRRYPAGSHVVAMAQPYGAFAKMLLERQRYPDLRQYPGGPPQRPYDVTAHTLPLLMGVEAVAVRAPFEASLESVTDVHVPPGTLTGRGGWIALRHTNGPLVAVGRLLKGGARVRWAMHGWQEQGRAFPAGTLLVAASAARDVAPLQKELGFDAQRVSGPPGAVALRIPRVGIYQSWVPAIDEGWTRFVLEQQLGLAFTTLHDADVRAGALRDRYDAIVLPDQSRSQLVEGHAAGSMPPEYTGGLGAPGVAALKAFVEQGGTLVALNDATSLPIADFGLGARNALEGVPPASFYCPGAILAARADTEQPLAHGLEPSTPVWFEGGPAFTVPRAGTAVLRYADADPLLSGWLLGGELLKSRAALLEVPLGKGRVVLFGFRPQYRGQSWGTYVALVNALYLSATAP